MKTIYRIYEPNLNRLQAEITKLNRRAAKLGVTPITCIPTGCVVMVDIKNEITGAIVGVKKFIHVEVIGQTPKFAGWTLAACVEHSAEGNILRKVPGLTIELSQFRTGASRCDHCNTIRTRRETYVVIHDDGTLKMVGSDCIKDFLGSKDPNALAAAAELCFSLNEICEGAGDEDFFEGGGSGRHLLHVGHFLSYSACAIRRLGFVSGKRAHEDISGRTQSTAQTARGWMNPGRNAVLGRDYFRPEDADFVTKDKAQQYVLDTLGSKPSAELSDFDHNLLTVCRCEALEFKNAGLLAFVPEYYSRALQQAQQAATEAFYGEPKKRCRDVALTYLKSTGWDSAYGYTYLHTFAGPDGVRILWKSGTNIDGAPGLQIKATFTVKEHEVFNGHKQTKVSRLVWETPAVEISSNTPCV